MSTHQLPLITFTELGLSVYEGFISPEQHFCWSIRMTCSEPQIPVVFFFTGSLPLTSRTSGPEKQTPYGLFWPAPLTDHIVLNYSKSLLLTIVDPAYVGLAVAMAIL